MKENYQSEAVVRSKEFNVKVAFHFEAEEDGVGRNIVIANNLKSILDLLHIQRKGSRWVEM